MCDKNTPQKKLTNSTNNARFPTAILSMYVQNILKSYTRLLIFSQNIQVIERDQLAYWENLDSFTNTGSFFKIRRISRIIIYSSEGMHSTPFNIISLAECDSKSLVWLWRRQALNHVTLFIDSKAEWLVEFYVLDFALQSHFVAAETTRHQYQHFHQPVSDPHTHNHWSIILAIDRQSCC